MDELREDFIAETRESLEVLTGRLIQWEKSPGDLSLIDEAFRFVHTVKGSCGFIDLPRLQRLSHAAEEVLSHARDGRITACSELVSATLAVIDRIAALTDALETGESVFDNDLDIIQTMHAFLPAEPAQAPLAIADDMSIETDDSAPDVADFAGRTRSRTVRVSLSLLDKLMNGVSDLVLARNEVSRQLRALNPTAEVDHAFSRLSSTVAEMRDAIGLMRMQHIDRLFSSLPRLLRDICVELDKQIDLTIEGSEVEVDREMVEALRDPLTHILRNSAGHGIESPDERKALGKSPVGQIHVIARQSGNQILIEISDDGQGINVEKLGQRAISRKVVTPAQWQKMTERARLETIFAPGLSTADTVASISGRGVGMDVVRANMHAIGGTIDLENDEGNGLKITLRLPLTLSIIAGLSMRAGDQLYGISRSAVVEIISVANRNVELETIGGTRIARVRGERLAYTRLEDVLGINADDENGTSRTLVVIRPAVGPIFALDVAAVVDNEELVVKPGAPLVMASGLYAGTTLPDNGRPMLLLDTSGLAASIGIDENLFEIADADDDVGERQVARSQESALLFISTRGETQAIRLSAVDRMEDIEVGSVFEIGAKLFVSANDKLTELLGLESVPDSGNVKVLRISDGSRNVFFAVGDVVDIFTLPPTIEPHHQSEQFEGIVHVDGQPVELLSVFRFFEHGAHDGTTVADRPLCLVQACHDDGWEQHILAPLLQASGYAVSFDDKDVDHAAVILSRGEPAGRLQSDGRVLHLRDTIGGAARNGSSVYRYDRLGLLSAIGAKVSGGI